MRVYAPHGSKPPSSRSRSPRESESVRAERRWKPNLSYTRLDNAPFDDETKLPARDSTVLPVVSAADPPSSILYSLSSPLRHPRSSPLFAPEPKTGAQNAS
jgi:hypothetical protein